MHFPSLPTLSFSRTATLSLFAGLATAGALSAHTAQDADTAFDAFNKAFLVSATPEKSTYRKTTAGPKTTDFWMYAEELEMVLDVYERTHKPEHKAIAVALLKGFTDSHGEDWAKNDFNDDICWASIAFSRASKLLDNPAYLKISRHNFDLMYARAWDDKGGGGLFWKTDNKSKNSCVEGPGVIAAWMLYKLTNEENYRAKATAIFDWERKTLFNPQTGEVYDNIRISDGKIGRFTLTYNSGTFIGAAWMLGHPEDAKRAADYVKQKISKDNLLPDYGEDGDLAGFNGIFLRWMVRFMKDQHLESDYLAWLQLNADAAWKARRASDNISWCQWSKPTAEGDRHSWGCSPTVVALQIVPPKEEK